ncbi:hypothetical protein L1D29_02965 [Shewanella insulae]|nr:hypothetical protein [Shewanella rhizosphaerae]MCG9711779.1 hypothetical protein [Shewanella insulae]
MRSVLKVVCGGICIALLTP